MRCEKVLYQNPKKSIKKQKMIVVVVVVAAHVHLVHA